MRETTWFAGNTCLWNDCQPWRVGRDEAQEERVHVHLKWRHGPHHSEVVHHEETVARQPVQTSTGEPARSQKVSVNVKVWQAAGEGVKLMLHLESTQVSQGDLFLIDGECKCFLKQNVFHCLYLTWSSPTHLARSVATEEETTGLAYYCHPGYFNSELLYKIDMKVFDMLMLSCAAKDVN